MCGFSELADLRAVFCGPAFPETACVFLPVQSGAMNFASELDNGRTVYLSQPVWLKTAPGVGGWHPAGPCTFPGFQVEDG